MATIVVAKMLAEVIRRWASDEMGVSGSSAVHMW